ncbi:MAG: hypothetical protein PHU27_03275 [Salinivirgaceae bacterium]|nr:hypothetical protein [Salinivirgaceae bacterium]
MKNNIRNWSVVLLIAIYCFAIGIVANSTIPYAIRDTQTTEQAKFFATVSTDLFYHTPQSENSYSNLIDFPAPTFKNPLNSYWVLNKTTEQYLAIAFSQYTFISRNFPIRYRKTNIIFPFHCFW